MEAASYEDEGAMTKTKRVLTSLLDDRKYLALILLSTVAYTLFYLYSIENIFYSPGVELAAADGVSLQVLDDWPSKIFRARVDYVWEPGAALYLSSHLAFFVSPLNLGLGLFLGLLVGLNVGVAVRSYNLGKLCSVQSREYMGVLGALPSFLTGFACCAPTFVIAIGASSTATLALVGLRPFLIPLSIVAMVAVLLWTAGKRVPELSQTLVQGTSLTEGVEESNG